MTAYFRTIFRSLFELYVEASIHVGCAVVALYGVAQTLLRRKLQTEMVLLIFTGTVVAYSVLKYGALLLGNRIKSGKLYLIMGMAFVSALAFGFAFWELPKRLMVLWLLGMMAVGIYPLVRRFGIIKLFWVSAVVTYTTVILPNYDECIHENTLKIALLQWVFISVLMIPFEIYDSVRDGIQLGTLPQKVGIPRAKQLGYLGILLFILFQFYWVPSDFYIGNCGIALITLVAIYCTQTNQSRWYTSFWVEALPILWMVFLNGFDFLRLFYR
ncbi:hypothetical protein [Flavobacterium stagni]|uniref:Prenyltransferase n=1 Tax=Flavobacterium stagni TaxID=2506421 RepID=A0A4Q1K8F8_9FLAO|nr:hypothetical protein [Flavobacterium stagni]RXR21971.1 hypothetical protein EQG61_10845 [Flavobacterium stagni]